MSGTFGSGSIIGRDCGISGGLKVSGRFLKKAAQKLS
jgi:hypothetical protein